MVHDSLRVTPCGSCLWSQAHSTWDPVVRCHDIMCPDCTPQFSCCTPFLSSGSACCGHASQVTWRSGLTPHAELLAAYAQGWLGHKTGRKCLCPQATLVGYMCWLFRLPSLPTASQLGAEGRWFASLTPSQHRRPCWLESAVGQCDRSSLKVLVWALPQDSADQL